MDFKLFLEANAGKIILAPNLQLPTFYSRGEKTTADSEEIKRRLHQALVSYFQKLDPHGWKFVKSRYNFYIEKITDDYSEITVKINILPITPKYGTEEIIPPDHPSYSYFQTFYGGKSNKILYKTPKDALEDIPEDHRLAYRGISWEEWQSIRKKGYIQSRGHYNLGQEDFTLFSEKPTTALHYAHGFAPLPYQIGLRRPGVVIAVPKKLLLTHKDDPKNVPSSELGLKGQLNISHIVHAWMLTMSSLSKNKGYFEMLFKWIAHPKGWMPDFKNPKLGSGALSSGIGFSIRKIF